MDKIIEDFFNRYVFGWMYSDAGICEKHGANFGGVALICAYIDFMGKLYLGIEEDGKSEGRFTKFMDEFFDEKYKPFSKFIYSDYRCGLLHQFFPKRGAGITRGEENRVYHLVIDAENGVIPINLTVFFEDFQTAVKNYYGKLEKDKQLQENFLRVYQSMRNKTSQFFEELLNRETAKGPAVISTSTSMLVSAVTPGVSLSRDQNICISSFPSQPPAEERETSDTKKS